MHGFKAKIIDYLRFLKRNRRGLKEVSVLKSRLGESNRGISAMVIGAGD
jgi:hypothetical protein